MRLTVLLMIYTVAGLVGASDMRLLVVEYSGGVVSVIMDASIDAEKSNVERTLDNYENLQLLIPVVTESQALPADDPQATRVRSRIKGCVWFVCADLGHVMDIRTDDQDNRVGETLAELSDFESGTARWRLDAEGETTRVQLDAELEPDLWVPPMLGPYLLERKIRQQFTTGIVRLEQAAKAN